MLVKTALFGQDANWGRILCATGYAGVPIDANKVSCVADGGADGRWGGLSLDWQACHLHCDL